MPGIPDMRTAESAPSDTPILVWVRGANKDGTGAWKMGRVSRDRSGLPDELTAEGFNGKWDIPFWAPLPPKPE